MTPAPTAPELGGLGVTILPGVDVDALSERFRAWQAITHGFVIDNPMTSATTSLRSTSRTVGSVLRAKLSSL